MMDPVAGTAINQSVFNMMVPYGGGEKPLQSMLSATPLVSLCL